MLKKIRLHAARAPALGSMLDSLQSRTGRDTQIVLFGEGLGAGLGFLANVILLRTMPVSDYGLLSLFLSVMMLFSGLMHFGWIDTYVRYGAKYLNTPHFPFIRRLCLRKVAVSAVVTCVLVALFSRQICAQLLKREGQELLLLAAVAGAVANLLFSFAQNDYRVHRAFLSTFLTRVGSSSFRLACYVLLLLSRNVVTLAWSVAIQLCSLALFALHGLFRYRAWAPRPTLNPEQKLERRQLAREMGHYNLWVLVSYFSTTLIGNIDMQILSHYHSNQLLSNYGAATRLTLPFQLVISALTTTLLPRLSQTKHADESRHYLRRVTAFLAPAAVFLVLMIFLAPPVLVWIAGPNYSGISAALRLQLVATLVVFLSNPIGLVLVGWGWSRFFALLNLTQLVVDIALDLAWIPRHGVEGALAATVVVNVMGMIAIYLGLWRALRKKSLPL